MWVAKISQRTEGKANRYVCHTRGCGPETRQGEISKSKHTHASNVCLFDCTMRCLQLWYCYNLCHENTSPTHAFGVCSFMNLGHENWSLFEHFLALGNSSDIKAYSALNRIYDNLLCFIYIEHILHNNVLWFCVCMCVCPPEITYPATAWCEVLPLHLYYIQFYQYTHPIGSGRTPWAAGKLVMSDLSVYRVSSFSVLASIMKNFKPWDSLG